MPGGDVPDFMAQYPGKLRFVAEMRHDAAGEIDKAAGEGKGIDHRGIQDFELIVEARTVGDGGHLLSFCRNERL